MVADRTLVTELATGLGTLPFPDLPSALGSRSSAMSLDDGSWQRLHHLYAAGRHRQDFVTAYRNGQAFAAATEGLRGRPPRLVEWTGGRRPSGDEVAPIDLRIDHVYLVSCKYLSANLQNASPARLFCGLLATSGQWERNDWYELVAPEQYQQLYDACRHALGLGSDLPEAARDLSTPDRGRLRDRLRSRAFPVAARQAYQDLCDAVSNESAKRWRDNLAELGAERMLWRLLRVGNAPYFLLGAHRGASLRLRIDTTWDWHHHFELRSFDVRPARAGQPRVDWVATCAERRRGTPSRVSGHVEVRWSHGRFGQPPEAKVYLDTPIDHVPGYHQLETAGGIGQAPLPGIEP